MCLAFHYITAHAHVRDYAQLIRRWRRAPRRRTRVFRGAGTVLISSASMSLPRMLYAESYREPLLPSGTRASGGGSYPLGGHLDADITSDIQLELESESFATEPFHRFSNAAAAGRRRADATPNPRLPASAGTGGSSEERFSAAGGVDEKSEYSGAQPGINHARGASVGSALGSGKSNNTVATSCCMVDRLPSYYYSCRGTL